MAHIAVMISAPSIVKGKLHISGTACVSSDPSESEIIGWGVDVDWGSPPSAINVAITNAAIAAVQDAGYAVGVLDSKTLLASASAVSV